MKNKTPVLASWSWGDIQRVYQALGAVMQSYALINQRIDIPKPHIGFTDPENIFLMRWQSDIMRIEIQLRALDKEILRRNNLIGVIG